MNTCRVISKDHDQFEAAIKTYLHVAHRIQIVETEPADFTIVLGGDGTVLGAARRGELTSPVIVVNTGHLGFLSSCSATNTVNSKTLYSSAYEMAIKTIERVLQGEFSVTTRHMLTTMINEHTVLALNDVVIRPTKTNKLVELGLFDSTDELLIAKYRADGLIVATPTGSTAYSLSAGGSIVHPACQAFCVTPICPQGLTQRPLVLPHDTHLRIELYDDDLYLSLDGQDGISLRRGQSVYVTYNSHTVQTVNPTHSYYRTLQEKLGWGVRPEGRPRHEGGDGTH